MQKVQLSWPELDSQQWNEVSYLQLLVLHSGAWNFFEIIMEFESKVQEFLEGHNKLIKSPIYFDVYLSNEGFFQFLETWILLSLCFPYEMRVQKIFGY